MTVRKKRKAREVWLRQVWFAGRKTWVVWFKGMGSGRTLFREVRRPARREK